MANKPSDRIQLHAVKYMPPPADLPVYGSVANSAITVIGRSTHVAAMDEQRYVFGLLEADRARGVHVVGRAGMGKTKLLESMARQDIASKRRIAVIDGTGDLVSGIAPLLDPAAKADTAFLGSGFPASVSLLAKAGDELRFADTLASVAAEYSGSGFDPRLRRELTLLLRSRSFSSVAELARALPDTEAMQGLRLLMEDLLAHPVAEATISGTEPIRGSVLAVLPSAELGFSRARALANLVSDAVLWAREPDRRVLPFYVDGFELLGGRGGVALIRDMLDARVAAILAHRTYADLSDAVLSGLSSAIGTEVIFRLSGEDGPRARNELAHTFDVRDFLVLATRQCYVRLCINGELREPFSAETLPLLAPRQ